MNVRVLQEWLNVRVMGLVLPGIFSFFLWWREIKVLGLQKGRLKVSIRRAACGFVRYRGRFRPANWQSQVHFSIHKVLRQADCVRGRGGLLSDNPCGARLKRNRVGGRELEEEKGRTRSAQNVRETKAKRQSLSEYSRRKVALVEAE